MSHLISVEQLRQLQDVQILEVGEKTADPNAALLARNTYQQHHIPHAQYVDLNLQFSQQSGTLKYQCPTVTEFRQSFEALGLNWQQPIVIYDRANHIWAARLWWILSAYGHPQCYVLHGGWQGWSSHYPHIFESGDVAPKTDVVAHLPEVLTLNQAAFASLDEVIAVSQGQVPAQLINVLRPPVFAGTELRYHRAGHIPLSRNLPFSYFLTEQGQFKSIDSNFLLQHVLDLSKDIIVYCGSGITASGAALALLEAGAHAVKIYDGSMDEWSANPSLPLILSAE